MTELDIKYEDLVQMDIKQAKEIILQNMSKILRIFYLMIIFSYTQITQKRN